MRKDRISQKNKNDQDIHLEESQNMQKIADPYIDFIMHLLNASFALELH